MPILTTFFPQCKIDFSFYTKSPIKRAKIRIFEKFEILPKFHSKTPQKKSSKNCPIFPKNHSLRGGFGQKHPLTRKKNPRFCTKSIRNGVFLKNPKMTRFWHFSSYLSQKWSKMAKIDKSVQNGPFLHFCT